MSYASLEHLQNRFGEDLLCQLTDRATPAAGEIDTGVVDQALTDADAEIDSYLVGRYALPLTEVPPRVVDLALIISIYKLHISEPDQKIRKDYEAAIAALKDIGRGIAKLPIAGIEPASSGASGVVTTDRERDFTPENMRGLI